MGYQNIPNPVTTLQPMTHFASQPHTTQLVTYTLVSTLEPTSQNIITFGTSNHLLNHSTRTRQTQNTNISHAQDSATDPTLTKQTSKIHTITYSIP